MKSVRYFSVENVGLVLVFDVLYQFSIFIVLEQNLFMPLF